MRDLVKVLDKIIEEIPTSEIDLINQLKSVQTSASYAAPEVIRFWWKQAAEIFQEEIGEEFNSNDWKIKVFNIFMDTE